MENGVYNGQNDITEEKVPVHDAVIAINMLGLKKYKHKNYKLHAKLKMAKALICFGQPLTLDDEPVIFGVNVFIGKADLPNPDP